METGGTSSKAQDEQLVIVLHLGEGEFCSHLTEERNEVDFDFRSRLESS